MFLTLKKAVSPTTPPIVYKLKLYRPFMVYELNFFSQPWSSFGGAKSSNAP